MRALGLLLASAALAATASAEETLYRSASVASRWLSVPGSARVAALAGAYAARGADPAALESNPAGLAGMRDWQALLTHNIWVGGMSVDRLVGAYHLGCWGTVAGTMDYLNLGEAERYSIDAAGVPVREGVISSNSWALGAAWAADFGALALGASLKGLSENVASGSSAGFQGDLGMRWDFKNGIRSGLAAKNLGLDFSNAVRPIALKLGGGYSRLFYGRAVAFDGNIDYQPYDDEPPVFRASIEWASRQRLVLRGGYIVGNDRAPTGPTLGLGWLQGFMDVDYALYGGGELGWTHLISLRVMPFSGWP